VLVDEEDRTVVIRRRFGVPLPGWGNASLGRYVRLAPGQAQSETISLHLPVKTIWLTNRLTDEEPGCATRVILEIGYYAGDLPQTVCDLLREEGDLEPPDSYPTFPTTIGQWFGGLLGHNTVNEGLRDREEEIMIRYTDQAFGGERFVSLAVSDFCIPYEREINLSRRSGPDLTLCTKVELRYENSLLECFFPYPNQQSVLSPTEKELLESQALVVVTDPFQIADLANEISKWVRTSGVVRQRTSVQVTGYRQDELLVTFPVYNLASIVDRDGTRFTFDDDLTTLRKLTPHIESLTVRTTCSGNLRDLWHRLLLFRETTTGCAMATSSADTVVYPKATAWCDGVVQVAEESPLAPRRNAPYRCPGTGEGPSNYAMNPNCKPNSAGDTVLLFETKAGWNQHGGPELFTFDNHDPRGGCVLLNDGTVKFIRTEEELHALRWK
jgi:hypothetical protein